MIDRPLNKDTAAMWSLLALALLSQVGLAQGLVLATSHFSPGVLWVVMATASLAVLWTASCVWSPALREVFGWKRTSVAGLAIMATTIGPILEELLFRGFLWGVLADMMKGHAPTPTALVVIAVATAVIFALAHHNESVLYFWLRFGAGLVYGLIRITGRSCAPAAASHWAYNVALFITPCTHVPVWS